MVAKGSSISRANTSSPGRFWLFRQPFRQIFRGRGTPTSCPSIGRIQFEFTKYTAKWNTSRFLTT